MRYARACAHTHTHTHAHAHTHTCARTHTHAHAHTHARTNTHTHTHSKDKFGKDLQAIMKEVRLASRLERVNAVCLPDAAGQGIQCQRKSGGLQRAADAEGHGCCSLCQHAPVSCRVGRTCRVPTCRNPGLPLVLQFTPRWFRA